MWCWCFLFDQHENCRTQKCRCGMCVVRKLVIGLTGRLKSLQQAGSSAPPGTTCPETYTNASFTCTLSHTHGCICKCRTEHACTSHTTYWFAFIFQLLQILLLLLVLLGPQWQHRNRNYSASSWGHAVILLDSCQAPTCWKHLEGFPKSALRALPWVTTEVSSKSTGFSTV